MWYCLHSLIQILASINSKDTNMDWIKDKANAAAGGGKASEKNEDGLDKAYCNSQFPCHISED